MLRLSKISRVAAVAAALLASTPALAQGGGLGGRITDAGTKLDQDVQACKPIDLGEYARLLQEAGQNAIRAKKAAKAGVPINQAQVDADLANASALFNRAQAALVQQCMRAAQGQGQGQAQPQGQPQAATTPTPAPTPATTPAGQAGGGQGTGGTDSAVDRATAKLDADIKACRPINVADYQDLANETRRNGRLAIKAMESGAPIDAKKLDADIKRADQLLERARAAEAQQKACPPKREATTEPPPKTGAMLPNSRARANAALLNSFDETFLYKHNELRRSYGVPPVSWSPVLAQHAQARSAENAQAGDLVHAPREGRGGERENIAKAPASYTDEQIVDRWANEDLQSGIFPNVCASGDWQTCAHKSQMLWATTDQIGCGKTLSGVWWYIVCRYFPGGNKDGVFVGRRPDNYVEKVATAPNTTIRPRPVGGDYGGSTGSGLGSDIRVRQDWGAQQISQQAAADFARHQMPGRTAPLFDLGIYAGGAWTSDWFDLPSSDLPSQMALNHEYGYDSGLFVGYDLGAFRIEAEMAYKPGYGTAADLSWMLDNLLSLPPPDVDTKVEPPPLPKGELSKPEPPKEPLEPM